LKRPWEPVAFPHPPVGYWRDWVFTNFSSSGTFARVWLAKLAKPKDDEEKKKVFALKVLRKVEGRLSDR
jgi:hypothetical protein